MGPHDKREWDDKWPVVSRYLPVVRHEVGSEHDHHNYAREADDEREFEALPDAGYCI